MTYKNRSTEWTKEPWICPKCGELKTRGAKNIHLRWCGVPFNEEAFWDAMQPVPWSGCWIWTKATLDDGYGGVRWFGHPKDKRVLKGIHRVSWILTHGSIPDGMYVMHICDTPPCGNPAHLRLGTRDENIADKIAKGRHSRGETSRHAKLTNEQVIEIRSLRAAGLSAKELCERYLVTSCTISNIHTRRTWRHLP